MDAMTAARARAHAQKCRRCGMPILDAEGNPGLLGEACAQGRVILTAYLAWEAQVDQQVDDLLAKYQPPTHP